MLGLTTEVYSQMSKFEERLDRLAEVAIRVGLQLKQGQELVLTSPIEALPLVRKLTAHAYKAGCSLVTPLFSDDVLSLLRFRTHPMKASTRPAAGCLMAWRRHSTAAPHGSLSWARIRRCSRRRTRKRSPASIARARPPIARRWNVSSISTSTGTSSRSRRRPGPRLCFRISRKTSQCNVCGTRSLPPRGSTGLTQSASGNATTKH